MLVFIIFILDKNQISFNEFVTVGFKSVWQNHDEFEKRRCQTANRGSSPCQRTLLFFSAPSQA